jgi:hypothetical protein
MIRVYVAGPYSADNVIDVLKNIGEGEKACAYLFAMGYAPFCPWHDKTYVMDRPNDKFTVEKFYKYSIAWLEVSDCMLVIKGWKKSRGTLDEIERAKKLKIPIFYDVSSLIKRFPIGRVSRGCEPG